MTAILHQMTRLLALLLALGLGTAAAQQAAEPSAPISEAEKAVFTDSHLSGIEPPTTLHYRWVRSGTAEPPINDTVAITLKPKAGGGCCNVEGSFGTGPRALTLPAIDEAQSNPVILYFLEHDVREMQRLTRGQQAHFRRRIRLALAESASVKDTTFKHAGRALPAKEVRITPYVTDPSRNRFERYALKEYAFVLAPGVPGTVAQMRTRVPGVGAVDAPPLIEETVTLAEK